jgi:hypothetical protein
VVPIWGHGSESWSWSHFSLVANLRRESVNRSPQGAIRGGFAVSPQKSERFARCACCGGALAAARRERRASSMSAPWDSSPALSPVPWGERSREAFNCVPGDQQSAPLVNSFGVRDGAEPVDHRGDGSGGATNGACRCTSRTARERPSVGLLAAGALRLQITHRALLAAGRAGEPATLGLARRRARQERVTVRGVQRIPQREESAASDQSKLGQTQR